MPELNVHIQSSLNRTGKEYREVHQWIDNPETKYERHDFSKVLENAKMFTEQYGEEAPRNTSSTWSRTCAAASLRCWANIKT